MPFPCELDALRHRDVTLRRAGKGVSNAATRTQTIAPIASTAANRLEPLEVAQTAMGSARVARSAFRERINRVLHLAHFSPSPERTGWQGHGSCRAVRQGSEIENA